MEHNEEADRLEKQAERLEHESERVGGNIDETRREWEQKTQDQSVPGAQPDPEDESEGFLAADTTEDDEDS